MIYGDKVYLREILKEDIDEAYITVMNMERCLKDI